jgi:hypothetical protein
MRFWRIPLLLLLILAAAAIPSTAFAQAQVLDASVDYHFGDRITFQATLKSNLPVETAVLFFSAEGDTHTIVRLANIVSIEEDTYRLEYTHKLAEYNLRAFSDVDYRYDITLSGGKLYKSPTYHFYYEDNRFDWRRLEEQPFRVHWIEGDVAFAQSVLDVAQEGLAKVQSLLPLPAPLDLDIYVYPEAKTLQEALGPNSDEWVAGHAEPDLQVIIVALPPSPDQRLLMEQRIPHELMHTALFQATRLGYENIPAWLSEGLASQAELYPNPDYRIVMDNAAQKDSLLPMVSLCQAFPRDASSALLSYAQSASFIQYLHSAYGSSALLKLVNTYANGVDCERGTQITLGTSLTQLERRWRRDFLAENVSLSALLNLLPWLALLLAIVIAPLILTLRRLRRAGADHSTA